MAARLPARVLLDLPNWVGDQLMALPAVARLVNANRGGVTVLHTRPPMARLLATLFPVAEVVASRRRAGPLVTARCLGRSGGRFDLGITFRNATRAKLLLRLTADTAWGSPGQGASLLLSESFAIDRRRHQVHDADPMLLRLGLHPADPGFRVRLDRELEEEGRCELRRAGAGTGPLVGLAPATASGTAKRWPSDRFAQLAVSLMVRGLEPVVLVGPGEQALGAEIQAACRGRLAVVGAQLDVAGLAAVMLALSAVVSIDSGPMHLAAAVGTPVVALFGPTDVARTGPLGPAHRVVREALPCVPCGQRKCPLGHTRCMGELVPARVLDELLAVVSGRAPVAPAQLWPSEERRSLRVRKAT